MRASRATIWVHGQVQGVGFRWWTRARARELGLVGYARNTADGRVEVFAQGPPEDVEALIALLAQQPSTEGRPGVVERCVTSWGEPREGLAGFAER